MESFKTFRIHNDANGYRSGIEEVTVETLMPGEVLLQCRFSSVNYKDALAGTGKGKVVRNFPITGGIDCVGEVVESSDPRFEPGNQVLATGYGLGVSHDGGYAQYVRLPADWLVPLPENLGPFMAMALGTAGFTAGLALHRMELNGQTPETGPILVTGASGGVGNTAVALFSRNGYEVVAVTGKKDQQARLAALGASKVISTADLGLSEKPLDKGRWGGVVDPVGGHTLAGLLPQLMPWGNIACIGMAAGIKVETTVMPFILRGVSMLGIDSVECPLPLRQEIWQRLSDQLDASLLDELVSRVISLKELPDTFEAMLEGKIQGRILVEPR